MAAAPKIVEFQGMLDESQPTENQLDAVTSSNQIIYAGRLTATAADLGFYSQLMSGKLLLDETVAAMEAPSVEKDFYGWLLSQTQALQLRQYSRLDFDALAEELEAMAASQRRELKSRLHVLFFHLLKWQTQPKERQFRGRGWKQSIREARRQINDLIKESPSLRHYLEALLAEAWEWACEDAAEDAPDKFPENKFPIVCPWAYEEFMAFDFLPADLPISVT